jgi:hypothetical protein
MTDMLSIGDPDAINTIHTHTQGIGYEDFDDHVVGLHEDCLVGWVCMRRSLKSSTRLRIIAAAFTTRHMRTGGCKRHSRRPLPYLAMTSFDHQTSPIAMIDFDDGWSNDKRRIRGGSA